MSIRTSEEEKLLSERRSERKKVIQKFKSDFMSSFFIGIKIGIIGLTAIVLLYLVAKFLFKWDLFYETDLEYNSIVLVVIIIFLIMALLCCFVAFILYNTKHRRSTKYKAMD